MEQGDFDFSSKDEAPEELDYRNLTPCPACKKPIPRDATLCYYCGKPTSSYAKPLWIVWAAVVVIIAFVLFLLASI